MGYYNTSVSGQCAQRLFSCHTTCSIYKQLERIPVYDPPTFSADFALYSLVTGLYIYTFSCAFSKCSLAHSSPLHCKFLEKFVSLSREECVVYCKKFYLFLKHDCSFLILCRFRIMAIAQLVWVVHYCTSAIVGACICKELMLTFSCVYSFFCIKLVNTLSRETLLH